MLKFKLPDQSNMDRGVSLRVVLSLCGLMALTSCHDHEATSPVATQDLNTNSVEPQSVTKLVPPPGFVAPSNVPLSPAQVETQEAVKLEEQGKTDEALVKINALLATDPKNLAAYSVRGQIYSKLQMWNESRKDYETILAIDPKNVPAQFNLFELKFMQKDYDGARPGFVTLEKDPDWGDLATYKVFLCDLFGGHDAAAQDDLDVFNDVGANPSYYFGNLAWQLYHHRTEEARPWLASAQRIYLPWKVSIYSSSLEELGYLPIPVTIDSVEATNAPTAQLAIPATTP